MSPPKAFKLELVATNFNSTFLNGFYHVVESLVQERKQNTCQMIMKRYIPATL